MVTNLICNREYGIPEDTVRYEKWDLPKLESNQILIKAIASPINPADINMIEGRYAIQPPLPTVLGNEGSGTVVEIGNGVKEFKVGQKVICPTRIGSWSEYYIADTEQVILLPNDIDKYQAAMLCVNPPTAYRMLRDFVQLRPGDWVIQNAANSSVGRATIQFAKAMGFRTVNVVRRDELIPELKSLGADIVVTDKIPLSRQIHDLIGNDKVKLGLNAVGGESAREVAKCLDKNGIIVTYGAMSKEPIRIPNALLIFQNISFVGYMTTRFYLNNPKSKIQEMFDEIFPFVQTGKIHTLIVHTYSLSEARNAIIHAKQSQRNGKIMFVME